MWHQWFKRNFTKLWEYFFVCKENTDCIQQFSSTSRIPPLFSVSNTTRLKEHHTVVALLSMEGQKALGFHQNYLNLCPEDERRSYGFGATWGWVINDNVFILGWTIPLNVHDLFFRSNRVWIISGFNLKHLYSSHTNWIVSTIFSLIMSKSLIDWLS